MPGKIKVKVLAGRNLPVMDRASDTTDAFVEIKFGGVTHKTDVCRKSLNPHWSHTEWYRFEVDESELQDEPLQLRLMDHDTYSANDAIGKVVISLASLLAREAINAKGTAATHGGAVLSGWIPVFDTLHGIRGELHVIVKVELFSDFNKYKTSSCGVQFFHCPMIPPGYRATSIHGFVEELVVNDDPEYQWIDKIRTPRASNEARQVAFIKLSNQVQRLVGLKAAELGANAVVGYQQDFDLEGEAGVVARAIGTAVSITPLPMPSIPMAAACTQQQLKKYLDILATDTDNMANLSEYYQTHNDELQKLISILGPKKSTDDTDTLDDDEKSFMTRQSSIKSYGSYSVYQDRHDSQKSFKDLSDDQNQLNKLLNRKDEDDSDSSGPLQKFKNLKTTIFSKRLGSIRSRKSDKQDDQVSIKSNSSETSRLSLTDFKNEFKKLRKLKKPKVAQKVFTNEADEGIGMASILARSVIHAHTSLACIAESQDSEASPCSTLRRAGESEPTLVSDDETKKTRDAIDSKTGNDDQNLPEIQFTSLTNINEESADPITPRKLSESCPSTPLAERSDNLLKLPGEVGYFGSVSSALSRDSSELYSSSEDEDYDESSDQRTDTERYTETTSSVVHNVLNKKIDPIFLAHMEKKLSVLESVTPEPQEKKRSFSFEPESDSQDHTSASGSSKSSENENNKNEAIELTKTASTSKEAKSQTSVNTKSNPYHFKFHNPFSHKKVSKSMSAPSSPVEKKGFVYRSSHRIKRQISKISNSSMIKSLSHYSLRPKKKSEGSSAISQPSSTSDVASKTPSHETVLGSPFLSYTDLLTLDKENAEVTKQIFHKSDEFHPKVSMYIGSEPVSRASISIPSSPNNGNEEMDHKHHKKDKPAIKPTGLLHTAMETILMDKVDTILLPTSPDCTDTKEKQFFHDVNKKLEKVEETRAKIENITQNTESNTAESNSNTLIENVKVNVDKTIEQINKANLEKSDLNTEKSNVEDTNIELKDPKCKNNLERKLTRQDSVDSQTVKSIEPDTDSLKMSKVDTIVPRNHTTPMLQHFHPILCDAPKLETIPSLPESSVDRSESLDIDGVDDLPEIVLEKDINVCESNIGGVCDNSHAAWRVDRNEKERDKDREKEKCERDKGSPRHARHESFGGREPVGSAHAQNSSLNASSTPLGIHRRSSDSDLSVTPKGGSLNTSTVNAGSGGGAILKPSMNSNNLEMLEYPFLTMTEYPSGFIVHIGGTVCARSVKLIDSGGESAMRAAWWAELRTELRAHARALRCNAVIAYTDTAHICEDVCVLSASGTAAVINLDCDFNADLNDSSNSGVPTRTTIDEPECCSKAHVPYSPGSGPYRAELSTCGICRRARVPAVLLATCAKPNRLSAYTKAVPLTAVAARVRRAAPSGEPGARDISDQLPFLEYELHKLLLAKLRMQGANAVFSLQTQVALGERCVVALASGAAVRLKALPPPQPPRIKASENDKAALELQKALWDSFNANKTANGYDSGVADLNTSAPLAEVANEEIPVLDLCADKDACVLELDEAEDVETARLLAARHTHMQVFSNSLEAAPAVPPHAFAQVWRARLSLSQSYASAAAEKHVSRTLDGVTYKLRRLQPCALAAPKFQVELPEDEIQLVLSGTAIPLADPSKVDVNVTDNHSNGNHGNGTGDEDEIFALDEEQLMKSQHSEAGDEKAVAAGQVPTTVSLTTLPYMSGARIHRRICALRLLFVRETTTVRELGGLSGFLHTATCEVLAIVRSYTAGLGGNALTSFYLTQLMLQDNAHKNQGQCLLSVGGDVVHITY